MLTEQSVLAADNAFFEALLQANGEALGRLLVDDFVLVDVLSGGEVEKALLLPMIGSASLTFEGILREPTRRVRFYGPTAVVTGQTRMSGQFQGARWSARSRYTHVFVQDGEAWHLASAQGTPIAGEA